jgi:hypothetical protein
VAWAVEKRKVVNDGDLRKLFSRLAHGSDSAYCRYMDNLTCSNKSGEGWRAYFSKELEKLDGLPAGVDSWRAHKPPAGAFKMARAIVDAVTRAEMPLPFVAAGSDGSIEVKWRRNPKRELSCFIEPATTMVLLVRDGQTFERDLDEPSRINEYINGLFD